MPFTRCGRLFSSMPISSRAARPSCASSRPECACRAARSSSRSMSTAPTSERHPAALRDLEHVRARKMRSTRRNGAITLTAAPERPAPAPPDHEEGQHGGDHHRAGDGDAVGVRQRAGRLERRPPGRALPAAAAQLIRGHVDLALLGLGGPADLHARQEAELDRLLGQREGAGDHGLAGDDGREGRQPTIGSSAQSG